MSNDYFRDCDYLNAAMLSRFSICISGILATWLARRHWDLNGEVISLKYAARNRLTVYVAIYLFTAE